MASLRATSRKEAPKTTASSMSQCYWANPLRPSISLTLPKTQRTYDSPILFPFFSGLLAEGVNKEIQCRLLKIDENDDFTRLLKTAGADTIGAIAVKEIIE
ncbi:HipA N-terminal domain-containing protein [Puia sp. P3]|uniref:HipA N-terminal domain-containing protein n=1 Tax=Puia sp. P3 TaxID=3423952 RepID=UPI003D666EB7